MPPCSRALAARDLRYDAAAHHILADAVALRAISQHEALAVAVSQHRALKEQRGNYAGAHQLTGPYRRAGLKLDELHIAKLCAGLIGHGHTVAAGISLVRGNGIDAAIAAACQHHRIRPEIQPPLSRGVIRRAPHTRLPTFSSFSARVAGSSVTLPFSISFSRVNIAAPVSFPMDTTRGQLAPSGAAPDSCHPSHG